MTNDFVPSVQLTCMSHPIHLLMAILMAQALQSTEHQNARGTERAGQVCWLVVVYTFALEKTGLT